MEFLKKVDIYIKKRKKIIIIYTIKFIIPFNEFFIIITITFFKVTFSKIYMIIIFFMWKIKYLVHCPLFFVNKII